MAKRSVWDSDLVGYEGTEATLQFSLESLLPENQSMKFEVRVHFTASQVIILLKGNLQKQR